jgi:exodeoxyribonuclease-3
MPTIATWNVNSIKARLPNVLDWLRRASPDVAVLQEIKCETPAFPYLEIEDLGYNVKACGQKSYNGVAMLAKRPLEDIVVGLPGADDDSQARYLEATVGDLRIVCLYLPNGNPVGTEKYPYKLAWMGRLKDRIAALLATEQPLVVGGDWNVIPADMDCYDPASWVNDALFKLDTRRRFREILHLGMTDAFRVLHPNDAGYTFWDYQGRAFPADRGLRIDHILLSPQAADRLAACDVDREPRGRDKASDHTPVVVRLDEPKGEAP